MCQRRQNLNSQECINRNIDYLNEQQRHETAHQNNRMMWILTVLGILFAVLTQMDLIDKNECLQDAVLCIIIVGLLLSVSGIYSISVSEVSIGRLLKTEKIYKKIPNKPQEIEHWVITDTGSDGCKMCARDAVGTCEK